MSEDLVAVVLHLDGVVVIKDHWCSDALRVRNAGTACFEVEHWDGKDWVPMRLVTSPNKETDGE